MVMGLHKDINKHIFSSLETKITAAKI